MYLFVRYSYTSVTLLFITFFCWRGNYLFSVINNHLFLIFFLSFFLFFLFLIFYFEEFILFSPKYNMLLVNRMECAWPLIPYSNKIALLFFLCAWNTNTIESLHIILVTMVIAQGIDTAMAGVENYLDK